MPVSTPSTLSGIAACYEMEADLTASTLGQYGPMAGRPEPQEDAQGRRPALVLSATGEQTATTTLDVVTQQAGNVGAAGFRWRRIVSGVTDDYWRGGNLPNELQGAAFPGWAAVTNQGSPHAVTLPDDSQVVVYWQTSGVDRDIRATVWSPSTASYSTATVVSGLDASHNPSPALALIADPGGGEDPILLCAYWVADDALNEAQISVSASRDGGATWALWASNTLPAAITINSGATYYTLGQIRWTQIGSQMVMFTHVTEDTPLEQVWQYASGDLGVSFTKVGELDECGYPDVVTVGAAAYLAYFYQQGGAVVAVIKPVPNAWVLAPLEDLSGNSDFLFDLSDAATYAAGVYTFGALSITAAPTGLILASLIRPKSTGEKIGYTSLYSPATDTVLYGGRLTYWNGTTLIRTWWWDGNGTSTEYPTQLAATWYRGQVRMYCIYASGTTTYDDRLTRLDIGGASSITLPSAAQYDGGQIAWRVTSIPTALASAYGATYTTAGVGTRSISTNPGWETLVTTVGQSYYERTVTASATQQVIQLLRVQVDSGGGVSSRVIACGIRAAGVGYGFEFELRFSTTQIRFRDVNGASDETTVTVDTTAGVDVLMAIAGDGTASAWYRTVGTDEDQYFLPIEVAFALTDDAGVGGTTNIIMWGNRASGTATTRWIDTAYNSGDPIDGSDLAAGLTLPTDLRGITYAGAGAYVAANVYIGATGGPTLLEDEWLIRPDAQHPIRYLGPAGDVDSTNNVKCGQRTSSTEAASAWWSTATTGDVVLQFYGAANRYMTPITAIHTERLNAANPSVIGYNADTAAWTVLGTLTNTQSGLRYIRASASSPTVRVDTSGTSTGNVYYRSGSLKGGYFIFAAGAKVRPILDNTDGRWSNDGNAPPLILTLGGIDGTEATSGSAGIIIYPRATFIFASTASTEYAKFGLRWTAAPDLYEAQIRATVLAACPLEPLLYAEDWGCNYRSMDPAEVFESRAGLRRGRKVLNAPRRTLTVPFTALLTQYPLLDPTTWPPIWYKAYDNASYPIAGARGDEVGKLLGAWQRAGGSQVPTIWVPRLSTAATTQSLVGPAAGFYCRVMSPPSFTDDFGRDTGSMWAPVFRGDNWTLEEEI